MMSFQETQEGPRAVFRKEMTARGFTRKEILAIEKRSRDLDASIPQRVPTATVDITITEIPTVESTATAIAVTTDQPSTTEVAALHDSNVALKFIKGGPNEEVQQFVLASMMSFQETQEGPRAAFRKEMTAKGFTRKEILAIEERCRDLDVSIPLGVPTATMTSQSLRSQQTSQQQQLRLFAQNVRTDITANKNLNLPTEEDMVARAICEEIAKTMFVSFIEDEEWCELSVDAKSYFIPGFGRKLTLLFERCLSRYDEKAKYFHERERRRGRESLTQKLIKHVEPTVSSLLQNLHSLFLAKFKDAFDKAVNEERFPGDADIWTLRWIDSFRDWSAAVMMEGATWDITVSERNFRAEVKAHIMSKLKAKLDEALKEPVKAALRTADENTWPSIRTHFLRETALTSSMSLLHDEDKNVIKSHARSLIVSIARKEAEVVFKHMEERFHQEFVPLLKRGGWKGKEGIKCIAKQARAMSLKLLEAMVAVRLEDYKDNVGKILSASCLVADGNISGIPDSSTWIGIPASVTVITPSQCRSLLRSFWVTSNAVVDSILVEHDANESEYQEPVFGVQSTGN